MKLSKERQHTDYGTWKPVKLTRKERLEVFNKLKAGGTIAEFENRIPVPQLEMIVNEFAQRAPKPKPAMSAPRGPIGKKWYCDSGCGRVLTTLEKGKVWRAREKGKVYLCEPCRELVRKHHEAEQTKEAA